MIAKCSAGTWVIATTLLASLVLNAAEIQPVPVTGKIKWIYSYEEGKTLARQTGRPMFVVFRCER